MQDLSTLRTRWAEIEAEETRLLRAMTIADRLRAFAMLYDAFAPRLTKDTAYQAEREAALIERQHRLMRLAQWLKEHPEDSSRP
jgi:hypothetical protein